MRWHPTIIKWCIALHEKSPAAYKTLRNSCFIKSPHVSTLAAYTNFPEAKSGINEHYLEKLLKEANLSNHPSRNENVCIIFDEMKIKSGLVFSENTGKITGFTELRDINDEIEEFQCRVANKEEPRMASHVLVLMVQEIFSSLQQPLAYYPGNGLSGYQLWHVITDFLESYGFKV